MNNILINEKNQCSSKGCSTCSSCPLAENSSCPVISGKENVSCYIKEEKKPVVKQSIPKRFFMKKANINTIQRFSWAIVPLISLGGLWYHKIGLIMPVMLVGLLILSFFRGRFWCGNLCPRGAFLEIFIKPLSFYGKIPELFKSKYFRLAVVTVFMTVFTLRTKAAFGAWTMMEAFDRWGLVFAMLCLVTTIIAVILGVLYSPRAWCSFCPMGTIEKGFYNINKYFNNKK